MNKFTLMFAGLALSVLPAMAQTPAYLDETKPIEERIGDALGRMTLEKKIGRAHV